MLSPLGLLVSVHALAQSQGTSPRAATSAAPAAAANARFESEPSAGPEPIRIDYRAPNTCPSAATFLDDVLSRTPRARAAAPHELARVFSVRVGSRGSESFGEITVRRPSDTSPVRLSAVGRCENVLNTLAQFAALNLDPAASLASAQERELPQNPYLNWAGPIAPPLPDNPYRQWSGTPAADLPENPYRSRAATLDEDIPGNPYRDDRPSPPEFPDNPYRIRASGGGR